MRTVSGLSFLGGVRGGYLPFSFVPSTSSSSGRPFSLSLEGFIRACCIPQAPPPLPGPVKRKKKKITGIDAFLLSELKL